MGGMKFLVLLVMLVMPSVAKERTWVPAMVESSSRALYNGGGVGPYMDATQQSVRESIYLDAGEWLYHVTWIVTARGTLNLRDGAKIEVAEEGKKLLLRVNGKEHKLNIEERSRGKKK
jgi:hypothetical protein